ncbi:MAG: NAD(P)/FAD-dependent oxidoreductase [Candidatus Dojkabacteria bacterium]|nr:NAD(P)/FAD-dependent oxidoreductase [Candidatus Dojkabacteria bacterium]
MSRRTSTQERYNVIVVGAGFAGQSCVRTLANSDTSVLLIEQSANFHRKVCAEGMTRQDCSFISDRFMTTPFKPVTIHHNSHTAIIGKTHGAIATFDRSGFLRQGMEEIRKLKNVDVMVGACVSDIIDRSTLRLSDGRTISFDYLVGADGARSVVRQFLDLPVKNTAVAVQYTCPVTHPDFELHLRDDFESYFWIFPHRSYTKIGCGAEISVRSPQQARRDLDNFMKMHNFPIETSTLEAATLTFDYRGYAFGNIYLAGDAAGLMSGLTGKGIYAACVSGTVIARNILGDRSQDHLLRKIISKKRILDGLYGFVRNKVLRRAFFTLGMHVVRNRTLARAVMRLVN